MSRKTKKSDHRHLMIDDVPIWYRHRNTWHIARGAQNGWVIWMCEPRVADHLSRYSTLKPTTGICPDYLEEWQKRRFTPEFETRCIIFKRSILEALEIHREFIEASE